MSFIYGKDVRLTIDGKQFPVLEATIRISGSAELASFFPPGPDQEDVRVCIKNAVSMDDFGYVATIEHLPFIAMKKEFIRRFAISQVAEHGRQAVFIQELQAVFTKHGAFLEVEEHDTYDGEENLSGTDHTAEIKSADESIELDLADLGKILGKK